jgi:hypothetical protein
LSIKGGSRRVGLSKPWGHYDDLNSSIFQNSSSIF